MFKPLSLAIGLRYTRAKRRNGFISFISLTSMLGIALGVAVLITVLSVMNGFDQHIREGIFSLAPEVTVNGSQDRIDNWQAVEQQLAQQPQVLSTAPFIDGQGILKYYSSVQPAFIMGIDPSKEAKLDQLSNLMLMGKLKDLTPGQFGIILGQNLANSLGAVPGSKITLITPELSVTPAGVSPRFKRFTVVGVFDGGNGFGFDTHLAFINFQDAQALYNYGTAVSGINIKVADPYAAPQISHQLQQAFPSYYVSDWTARYGPFFKAIALEKTMMFLILLLIVAVAAFNLVSTLVMAVNDKQADIAILRTFGATPGLIMRVFMVQGMLVGFTGTFIGLIGGVVLALNVTNVVNWLQEALHTQLFQSSVYYINYLPSQLAWSDVIEVTVIALILSLLATVYPAWRASRTQPAEALRYE